MSTPIRTLIVDDEEPARAALKAELAKIPEIAIVAEAPNGVEAIKLVQEHDPDLLFLDIQMPRLDGFDTLELLGPHAPAVVFVTAYDAYALRAFEAKAVDYLLKPVRVERLQKALERVRPLLGTRSPRHAELLEEHQRQQGPATRLLVRLGGDVHVIPVPEVQYIEAQDDYVKIHTAQKAYLKTERLSRLEQLLDPKQFCRIHRSYLLNVEFLRKIEPYSRDTWVAKTSGGAGLPVSRAGYARLKELLDT